MTEAESNVFNAIICSCFSVDIACTISHVFPMTQYEKVSKTCFLYALLYTNIHCVKYASIQVFSDLYFPT